MKYNYYTLFLIFFIYAVLGYIVESSLVSITKKEITFSRGFLIGPYLPVFGFGGLIMTVFFSKYQDNLAVLFMMSMLTCLILEYTTSYILEKIFNLRWWDYSAKKYNLNGRICLNTGVMFGIGGIISIRIINPIIERMFCVALPNVLSITAILLTGIFVIDLYLSVTTIVRLKSSFSRRNKDSTREVKRKVIEELKKNGFFTQRLFKHL